MRPGPTQTPYFFGDDPGQLGKYAWYFDNSTETTHEVGQKQPRPLGPVRHLRQRLRMGPRSLLAGGLQEVRRPVDQLESCHRLADEALPAGAPRRIVGRRRRRLPIGLSPRIERRRMARDRPEQPEEPLVVHGAGGAGRRLPHHPPAQAGGGSRPRKYWDSDLASITLDAKDRLDQGRGPAALSIPTCPTLFRSSISNEKMPAESEI